MGIAEAPRGPLEEQCCRALGSEGEVVESSRVSYGPLHYSATYDTLVWPLKAPARA